MPDDATNDVEEETTPANARARDETSPGTCAAARADRCGLHVVGARLLADLADLQQRIERAKRALWALMAAPRPDASRIAATTAEIGRLVDEQQRDLEQAMAAWMAARCAECRTIRYALGPTMGTYRTVTAELRCARCDAGFSAEVQFKTGDDGDMPSYDEGDLAPDLAPGTHEGISDAFCDRCMQLVQSAINRQQFRLLRAAVAAGRLRMWRARWRLDAATRTFIVVRLDAAELSVDAIDRAAAVPQTDLHNLNCHRFFHDHEVWDGDVRLSPRADDGRRTTWHDELREAVDRDLPPGETEVFADRLVVVDAAHRVHVQRPSVPRG